MNIYNYVKVFGTFNGEKRCTSTARCLYGISDLNCIYI